MTLTARFQYEVVGFDLNLYQRSSIKNAEGVLKFLTQVPFDGNLEEAVKTAVKRVFRDMPVTPTEPIEFTARDLRDSLNQITGVYEKKKVKVPA